MEIEEKYNRLSYEAQEMAEVFIDFLLSREDGGSGSQDEEVSEDFKVSSSASSVTQPEPKASGESGPSGSGIILAEECMIEEESVIDFADINTRFAKKDTGKDKTGPVRQRKMFDWL
jgi:hypothetical protein